MEFPRNSSPHRCPARTWPMEQVNSRDAPSIKIPSNDLGELRLDISASVDVAVEICPGHGATTEEGPYIL